MRKNKQKSSKSLDEKDDDFEELTVPQSSSLISQKLEQTEFKDKIIPKETKLIAVTDEFVKAKVQKVDILLSGLKNKYN